MADLVLYAISRAARRPFLWLEVPFPGISSRPVALGWVPEAQRVIFDTAEAFRPSPNVPEHALRDLIRTDEPNESRRRLVEFLALPEACQRVLAERSVGRGPDIVAIADARLVLDSYATVHIGPIVDAHRRAGVSLFVSCADASRECQAVLEDALRLNAAAFEFVVRAEVDDLACWEDGRWRCEKGPGQGPFRTGFDGRIGEMPFLANVFRAAGVRAA